MRLIGILSVFIFLTGCSVNFSSMFTVGGMTSAAVSKNNVSLAYNAIDLGTQMNTGKNIRQHIFETKEENEDE